VAERKDVLAAFFWMLAMGAYISYVERPGLRRRLVVLLCFVLGLMAKPMLVTLPFVLLLLDYWPLKRFMHKKPLQTNSPSIRKGKSRKKHTVTEQPGSYRWALIRPLLLEKIPLFVLAALSSVVTYIVQRQGGAVTSIEAFPLTVRLGNAFVSYMMYMGKMLWPIHLAVFYPHPGSWPPWEVLGAVLLLIAITSTVVWRAERLPYLAVGWLWYVGTLVPVIGIVQVGEQAMADRYTYIPLVGLFIMAAWGMPELVKKWRYREEALGASSTLVLACLFMATWTQVGYWQNSITLYDHTLEVTDHNSFIHNNRGAAYNDLGNYTQAIEDYDRGIEINPIDSGAYYDRGIAYSGLGNHRRAIEDYDRAIEINPRYAEAYNNRGFAYNGLGNYRQAIEDCGRAIEINPRYAEAYENRGIAYSSLGNHTQAIEDFDRAIEINRRSAAAYNNRGGAYYKLGNYTQAIEDFDRAIEINPRYALAYNNRGVAYDGLGNHTRAIEDLRTAARLGCQDAKNFLGSLGIDW
jgi:Flp pilus assembly protein TadD